MYLKYLSKVFYYRHPRLSYMIPNKDSYTLKTSLNNAKIIYLITATFGIYWYTKTNRTVLQKKELILRNTL